MKVLLVDDSTTMRNLQIDLLKSLSITDILQAASGEEALRLLLKEGFRVDCVILDIKMPGLSGLQTLKAIREQSQEISIIVCSGVAEVQVVKQAILSGANNYLLKPFVRDDLLMRFNSVMNRNSVELTDEVADSVEVEVEVADAVEDGGYFH